ncbi:MAG: hypothetical protein V1707_00085 [bacterium]
MIKPLAQHNSGGISVQLLLPLDHTYQQIKIYPLEDGGDPYEMNDTHFGLRPFPFSLLDQFKDNR